MFQYGEGVYARGADGDWANDAMSKARLRLSWAKDARDKARLRMKWAEDAMKKK